MSIVLGAWCNHPKPRGSIGVPWYLVCLVSGVSLADVERVVLSFGSFVLVHMHARASLASSSASIVGLPEAAPVSLL